MSLSKYPLNYCYTQYILIYNERPLNSFDFTCLPASGWDQQTPWRAIKVSASYTYTYLQYRRINFSSRKLKSIQDEARKLDEFLHLCSSFIRYSVFLAARRVLCLS